MNDSMIKLSNRCVPAVDVTSAWKGLECVVPGIVDQFCKKTDSALEFGVDTGYSTSVLAQLFTSVIGVDTFEGDVHAKPEHEYMLAVTSRTLSHIKNIKLIQSCFEDYIKVCNDQFDLIHVDIVHFYDPTYQCADWALNHSPVVILHDTESFPEVKQVCIDLAKKHNRHFLNFEPFNGLGILLK